MSRMIIRMGQQWRIFIIVRIIIIIVFILEARRLLIFTFVKRLATCRMDYRAPKIITEEGVNRTGAVSVVNKIQHLTISPVCLSVCRYTICPSRGVYYEVDIKIIEIQCPLKYLHSHYWMDGVLLLLLVVVVDNSASSCFVARSFTARIRHLN